MIDLSKLSNAKLAVAYNGLAAALALASVNKFSDRATGEKRVRGLADKLTTAGKVVTFADDGAATISEPKLEPKPEPKPEPESKPKSDTKKRGQGRPASFEDSDKILLLVDKNPKKGTAAARFALYRDGMTVGEYVAAVAKLRQPVEARQQALRDLAWDTKAKQRFVRVLGAKQCDKILADRAADVAEAKAKAA